MNTNDKITYSIFHAGIIASTRRSTFHSRVQSINDVFWKWV